MLLIILLSQDPGKKEESALVFTAIVSRPIQVLKLQRFSANPWDINAHPCMGKEGGLCQIKVWLCLFIEENSAMKLHSKYQNNPGKFLPGIASDFWPCQQDIIDYGRILLYQGWRCGEGQNLSGFRVLISVYL